MTKVIDGPDYHRRLESFLLLYFSDPNLPGLHEVIKLLRTIEEAKAKTVGDNEAPILAKLRVAVELPVKDLKPLLVFW